MVSIYYKPPHMQALKKTKKFTVKKWYVKYDGDLVGVVEAREGQDKVKLASMKFESVDKDGFPAWDLDKLEFLEVIPKQ